MNPHPLKAQAPTGIRLPEDLRAWLRQQACENSRSLNQEILHRLKLSRSQQQEQHQGAPR